MKARPFTTVGVFKEGYSCFLHKTASNQTLSQTTATGNIVGYVCQYLRLIVLAKLRFLQLSCRSDLLNHEEDYLSKIQVATFSFAYFASQWSVGESSPSLSNRH